jgi:hypothetical protein
MTACGIGLFDTGGTASPIGTTFTEALTPKHYG